MTLTAGTNNNSNNAQYIKTPGPVDHEQLANSAFEPKWQIFAFSEPPAVFWCTVGYQAGRFDSTLFPHVWLTKYTVSGFRYTAPNIQKGFPSIQ